MKSSNDEERQELLSAVAELERKVTDHERKSTEFERKTVEYDERTIRLERALGTMQAQMQQPVEGQERFVYNDAASQLSQRFGQEHHDDQSVLSDNDSLATWLPPIGEIKEGRRYIYDLGNEHFHDDGLTFDRSKDENEENSRSSDSDSNTTRLLDKINDRLTLLEKSGRPGNLSFRRSKTNRTLLPTMTSSTAIGSAPEIDKEIIVLERDSFSLMMRGKPFSKGWYLGVFSFCFQLTLLYVGPLRFYSSGTLADMLVKPPSAALIIMQILALTLCLITQSDILSAIHTLLVLRIGSDVDWESLVTQDRDGIPPTSKGLFWTNRIFLPNTLKLIQGILVLAVSVMVVLQSENAVDLLKDYTALLVISQIDNVTFSVAEFGFLGGDLEKATDDVKSAQVQAETTVVYNRCILLSKMLSLSLLLTGVFAYYGFTISQQIRGQFFYTKYPYCNIEIADIIKLGNGYCDGGAFNTIACGFDFGDCINYNLAFPNCKAIQPELVGDNVCNFELNNEDCNFDGGDCCPFDYGRNGTDPRLGDGICHGGKFFTQMCSYDEFDCQDFRSQVPNCDIKELADLVDIFKIPRIGDGICDSGVYNSEECLYEDGDCVECNFQVYNFLLTGDGICHGGNHNNRICNFDAGDCDDFNRRYPRCMISTQNNPRITATLKALPIIGDGICNSGIYNIEDCGFEDGECVLCNQLLEQGGLDRERLGDGQCDGQDYMNEKCGMDGGDCAECPFPRATIGDGWCNPEYNIPECGYDGGDCAILFNFPGCEVEHPSMLGNGYCNGGEYGSQVCGYDAGDCRNDDEVLKCPDERTFLISDGHCDGFLNNAACGYDGNDCDAFNLEYPGCDVDFPDLVGNGWCSGGNYNTEACQFDGGDCLYNTEG